MILMSFKVDLKLVAVTCIFLGLFLGFYVDSSLISKPRIEALTEQIETQQTTIDNMTTSLSTLQSNHNELEEQYNEQLENNVPLDDHEALQEELTSLEDQVETLIPINEGLEDDLDDLEAEYNELETEYNDLITDHDKLQERFNQIYNPGYVAFSYEDLDINLTVTEIYFESHSPIEGTITIKHSDGELFEGSVKLRITRIVTKVGSPSDYLEINGETDYSWSGGFVGGAGSYKLSLSEVLDDQQEQVVPTTVLHDKFINIFMG